ncbi:hypothetical protein AMECASPLE_021653 [Ameca splendens]|uniref:Secreted protein n=1 Tax=Ameca splendens TaxID=208324 RepID=A0ABV0XSJ6_9TELE
MFPLLFLLLPHQTIVRSLKLCVFNFSPDFCPDRSIGGSFEETDDTVPWMAVIKGVVFVLQTGGNNFNSVLNPPGSRHPAVTWRTHGLLRQQKHRDSACLSLSIHFFIWN